MPQEVVTSKAPHNIFRVCPAYFRHSWWGIPKNAVCCFGCHRSVSLLGFMTASVQLTRGRGTNSTSKSGQDRPGGSHSAATGAEPSVLCGKEPEISESVCVHLVAEEAGGSCWSPILYLLGLKFTSVFPPRDYFLSAKRFLTYHIYKCV